MGSLRKLTAVPPRTEPESGTGTRELSWHGRPLHVLIVDDNDDAREMLSVAVAMGGHTSETAAGGLEAIERAVGGGHDAVFLDVGLPDIEGYEVARRIRAALGAASPRLIALTGYSGPDEEERAKSAGFDLRLTKPAELDQIVLVLAQISQIPSRRVVAPPPFVPL
jgi:CheY-like chemotaxis protein